MNEHYPLICQGYSSPYAVEVLRLLEFPDTQVWQSDCAQASMRLACTW